MSVSRLTLFLSFILLACVPAGVYGQLKCKIEHYSTEDGLSHDGVTCIIIRRWPANWTADFKLNAPYQTTVQGHVENGKVTNLVVTPAARIKDVVMVKAGK